ncbi:Copia protein [Vitis vinifera]|uniref:Copia protein n=1 Tax=Vitis vinifera TaxID=29760 RepID=A0A438K465_VITVI|nr:Copia protein [Vitis vinifera]
MVSISSDVHQRCGKMGYLTGEKKAPAVDDPNYAIWDAENSMRLRPAFTLGKWNLLALLKSNLTSGTSSVSLAHTGNELYALSCRFKSTPWIIDSGASDHMTNSSNMFESYSPCPGNKKVRIADGPELGKTIGSARMINGLYYFEDNLPSNKIAQGLSSISSLLMPTKILQYTTPLECLKKKYLHRTGLGLAPIVPAQDLDLDLPIALRKGTRACTKHPIAKYISYSNLSDNYKAFTTNISKLVVPRNIQEALDEPSWKLAVFEEMNALKKNGTWEVVDLPREKKVVGCKWVFTIKSKTDGSVERYKVRLVAKDLEEEVFMSPPPGFEESFGVGKVCKLKKSLYGLKQSPRAWFERFGKVIKHYGYTQSQADHTMFTNIQMKKLKGKLAEEFEIKDLGALKYFLGMEFARFKEGIFVNQQKYVLDLLDETGMLGCKPAETPIEPNVKLQPTKAKNVKDWDRYQRLVGRLIYLSHTRPDIAFSVSMVATWLRGEVKKNVVARSSAEAEFRAVAHGICEIMWIRRLLEELKMTGSSPMKLYCDNKAEISVAHNPVLHDRTKHVEVDKHFIKEKIDNGLVCMTYILTEEQVTDVFTKGLHKRQFDFLVGKLAMEDIFKSA